MTMKNFNIDFEALKEKFKKDPPIDKEDTTYFMDRQARLANRLNTNTPEQQQTINNKGWGQTNG